MTTFEFTGQAIGGFDFDAPEPIRKFARDCAAVIDGALRARCEQEGILYDSLTPERCQRVSMMGQPLAEDWYVDGKHMFGTRWSGLTFTITRERQCKVRKV
jgi:hypothetical protein